MAAIAKVFLRVFLGTSSIEGEILKQIIMLCGAGLAVSILLMTNGLDLSPGFFSLPSKGMAMAPSDKERSPRMGVAKRASIIFDHGEQDILGG